MQNRSTPVGLLIGASLSILAFLSVPEIARATTPGTIRAVTGAERSDGTRSEAARTADPAYRGSERGGPLPASAEDIAAKARANAEAEAVARSGASVARTAEDLAPVGGSVSSSRAPTITGGRTFAGQFDAAVTPSDSTGAIGTTRYVQLVNEKFAIYSRTSNTPLGTGTLNALTGFAPGISVFDPQIIWDPTTSRFYYAADAVLTDLDNRLAFGFSKTASPSGAADWCKYSILYGSLFPDYPKLGDTTNLAVIGVNVFSGVPFLRSDALAVSKPAAGTACPLASSFTIVTRTNLRSSTGAQVFTPVPGNQIDGDVSGYIVARNGSLPSNKLWVFKVTGPKTAPVIDAAGKAVTLPFNVTVPPAASQPTFPQKLDTLDGRPMQAILARNPSRANGFSLWTQQTVNNGGVAAIRWEEINPTSTPLPTLRSSGLIASAGTHLFNAAISPDRRVNGASALFGNNFVVSYSVSSAALGINPRIVAGSSINGAAPTFSLIKDGVGPNRDFSCKKAADTCRWGDYSAATPDPASSTAGAKGSVWLTNQFAGSTGTSTAQSNWRTWIAAITP
jgi:hypothetical protein